jgi:hypothetical protein
MADMTRSLLSSRSEPEACVRADPFARLSQRIQNAFIAAQKQRQAQALQEKRNRKLAAGRMS